jgi:hypothetical protein
VEFVTLKAPSAPELALDLKGGLHARALAWFVTLNALIALELARRLYPFAS